MGRYADTQDAIFSVFGGNNWTAEGITTFPNDVEASGNEYVRVTIITPSSGVNRLSLSGICIIDIFTAYGNGPLRAVTIADKLDNYLQTKLIETSNLATVQFGESTSVPKGKDKDNPSLTRTQYTIPFNFYGVN